MIINASDAQNSVFANQNLTIRNQAEPNTLKKSDSGSTSINGSMLTDHISKTEQASNKKEVTRKQALHLVKEAFEKDQSMHSEKDRLQKEIDSLQEERKSTSGDMSDAKKLQKEMDSAGISKEDKNELDGIIIKRVNDLAHRNYEIYREKQEYEGDYEAVKNELSKSQNMQDATEKADRMLEASDKDYIGTLFQNGVDAMDQKREEEQKQAEEIKQKKDEEQEKIEAAKADSENTHTTNTDGNEAISRNIISKSVEQVLQPEKVILSDKDEVQQTLEKMMLEEKMIPEDLKGIVVDHLQ